MDDARRTATCLVRRDGAGVVELAPDEFDRIDDLRADPSTVVWLALRNPDPDDLRLCLDRRVLELGVGQLRGEKVRHDANPVVAEVPTVHAQVDDIPAVVRGEVALHVPGRAPVEVVGQHLDRPSVVSLA